MCIRDSIVLEELRLKIQDLYNIVCELEEEKYDWELKLRKQDVKVCLSSSVLTNESPWTHYAQSKEQNYLRVGDV